MNYPITYAERHAISVSSAIVFAMLANYFLFSNMGYWMVVAAFLVSPVTRGTTLRQGILSLIIILLTVLLSAGLTNLIGNELIIILMESILIIISGVFVFENKMLANRYFYLGILFIFVLLLETFAPIPYWYTLQSRIFHVMVGGLIGILCSQFIFPTKMGNDFKIGVLPTFYAMKKYLAGLTTCFLNANTETQVLKNKQIALQQTLVGEHSSYPNWIYETGFNPGLRSGFRFFLLQIEELCELTFAMHDIISRHRKEILPQEIASLIQTVSINNVLLIDTIIRYFEINTLKATEMDFENDIVELEKELKKMMPKNLELLDVFPDYIAILSYVNALIDFRKILLQLILAITNKGK